MYDDAEAGVGAENRGVIPLRLEFGFVVGGEDLRMGEDDGIEGSEGCGRDCA